MNLDFFDGLKLPKKSKPVFCKLKRTQDRRRTDGLEII